MVRRGLAPAAAALWAEMAREASVTMPAALIKHSARFVTISPAAGAVPAAVTALAEGVIQMMWLARLSYINRLKQEEAATENDHRSGRATQVDVHDVRFRCLEAEIWLNEEKAR